MSVLEDLGLTVKRLQHHSYHTLNAGLAPLGISVVQWNALREIDAHPDLCMHGLAERTFNSDQAFGTLMARLLRQKLVERQAGTGRTNLHRLTPRGHALLSEGSKFLQRILAKVYAPLTDDERAQLLGLLNKVLDDDPAGPTGHLAKSRPPTTSLIETLAGLVADPGRAEIRVGGPPTKKTSPKRAGRTR